MQETQDQSLGQVDPLEEEMAIHSIILAGKIPWTEEPGGNSRQGPKESSMTEHTYSTSSTEWPSQDTEFGGTESQCLPVHLEPPLQSSF